MQLEQILLPIRDELDSVEQVILSRSETSVSTINQVVQYIVANGGKRVRPALCILAGRVAGYTGNGAARIGAALEMVHTASLLHDDVVDNATQRRGKSSVNSQWGTQIAVLAGDFFWCKACQIVVDEGKPRILKAITDAIVGTTEGEVVELVTMNDIDLSEEKYLKIIRDKTALLLSVSTRAGGMLGEVSETMEHALARYGMDLGIAFQLADDALDYVADEDRFGKTNGTDLREGHLTLPLIYTLQRCTETERSVIKEALLSKTLSDNQLTNITEILHTYDGIGYTTKRATDYVEQAKKHLDPFKDTLEKEALLQLADYVIARGE